MHLLFYFVLIIFALGSASCVEGAKGSDAQEASQPQILVASVEEVRALFEQVGGATNQGLTATEGALAGWLLTNHAAGAVVGAGLAEDELVNFQPTGKLTACKLIVKLPDGKLISFLTRRDVEFDRCSDCVLSRKGDLINVSYEPDPDYTTGPVYRWGACRGIVIPSR